MLNLNRLASFIAIVDGGSFTRAAESLGMTKAMVSFNLKQLEAELGVALLIRTTRRMALTEVGERFYRECSQVMRDAESAVDNARENHQSLSGQLRVTSTAEYGAHFVVPALAEFSRLHPGLQIDYSAATAFTDLVAERFDVGIRLGQLSDSSHRAVMLQRYRILAVASPGYVAEHGSPTVPEELLEHNWLAHARLDRPLTWLHAQHPPSTVQGRGSIQANSAADLRSFALAGCGITVLPHWLVAEDLVAGRLLEVLADYRLPELGIFAVYPDTRHVPAKVLRFIEFLRTLSSE